MNLLAQQTLGERWLDAAGAQTWQLTVMAVVVWFITRFCCRQRPHLAYLLWMLVVVKAITPPLWSSPAGAFSWMQVQREAAAPPEVRFTDLGTLTHDTHEQEAAMIEKPAPAVVAVPKDADAGESNSKAFSLSIAQVRLSIWAGGSLALLGVTLFRWLRIQRLLARTAQPPERELAAQFQALAQRVGLRRPVQLLITETPLGPAAFGWWPGTVLLPASLVAECAPDRLRQVLAHELVHLRRGDTLAATLQLFVQCVWWYHPAIWWANRRARFERERACDEEVVAAMNCPPADYARMLVDILEWRHRLSSALAWPGMRAWDVTTLRLQSVLKPAHRFHARTPRWSWLILALAALVWLPGAGLRLAAAPAANEDAPKEPAKQILITGPGSLEIADNDAPEAAPGADAATEPAGDIREVVQALEATGLMVGPHDERGKTVYQIIFNEKFKPTGKPLPLEKLPNLQIVHLGEEKLSTEQVEARLTAVENLPAGASLILKLTEANVAAFSQIGRIKHLDRLLLEAPLTPEVLAQLSKLTQLTTLHLMPAQPSPTISLDWLAPLVNLDRLSITARVSDDDVTQIAKIVKLRQLGLECAGLTDEGLKRLAPLGALRILNLYFDGADAKITPAGLASLSSLKTLRGLHVMRSNLGFKSAHVTDEVFEAWRALSELRELWTGTAQLSERSSQALAAWPLLRSLNLHGEVGFETLPPDWGRELVELQLAGPRLKNAALASIGKLPKLKKLNLSDARTIDGNGLPNLRGLAELEVLLITGATLTGPGGAALADLKKVETMTFLQCQLGDPLLTAIGTLPALNKLVLINNKLTNAQVKLLTPLAAVETLNLSNNPIDDTAIDSLAALKRLQTLTLGNTQVTPAGIKRLEESVGRRLYVSLKDNTGWAVYQSSANDLLDEVDKEAAPAKAPAPNQASQSTPSAPGDPAKPAGQVLRGRIVDANGKPVPGVTITLWNGVATRWRGQEATTDPNGEYRFEPLKTGATEISNDKTKSWWYTGVTVNHPTLVTSDGLSWRDVKVPRIAGHEHELDFTMVPGGFVSGRLLNDTTGQPVPNVDLRLGSPSTRDGKFFVYATTDKAGKFVSQPMFPGKYELDVNSSVPWYPKLASDLDVLAGQNTTRDLRIKADDLAAYREHEQQQIAKDKERQFRREQAQDQVRQQAQEKLRQAEGEKRANEQK